MTCPLTMLLGYALFVQALANNDGKGVTHPSAPMAEIQLCNEGLGGYANATTNGLYAGGMKYDVTYQQGPYRFAVTPHLGVSYTDHAVHALPAQTQFDLGLAVSVRYDRYMSQLGWSHWSRGCAMAIPCGDYEARHNHGLDRLELKAGIVF